ncbi:MAG: hypothetical protein P4M09_22890 [Devosia sp.]|nr:hypothetical protein [Devosia sp.]
MTRALMTHEKAALLDYAKEHGRFWKTALQTDWYHARARGDRGAILHGLRNDPNFGHEGLEAFTLTLEDLPVGQIVRVKFGQSSQMAKVEGHTRTGRVKVLAWNASRNTYYPNTRTLDLGEIISHA